MKLNKLLLIVAFGIILTNVCFLVSCKKNENPKAIITVTDSLDYKIKNVMVVVYAGDSINSVMYIDPINLKISEIGYTDESGKVEFEFANEAIFKVYAEKTINGNRFFGEKVLILENNKICEKTIILEKQ